MKNKKNQGWNNLNSLDIDKITEGANLRENSRLEVKEVKSEEIKKLLTIPREFDLIIREAKKDKIIIGSINSYIIEAVRLRLIKDGLLIS